MEECRWRKDFHVSIFKVKRIVRDGRPLLHMSDLLTTIADRLPGSNDLAHRGFLFRLALFDYRVWRTWGLNLGVAGEAWLG